MKQKSAVWQAYVFSSSRATRFKRQDSILCWRTATEFDIIAVISFQLWKQGCFFCQLDHVWSCFFFFFFKHVIPLSGLTVHKISFSFHTYKLTHNAVFGGQLSWHHQLKNAPPHIWGLKGRKSNSFSYHKVQRWQEEKLFSDDHETWGQTSLRIPATCPYMASSGPTTLRDTLF